MNIENIKRKTTERRSINVNIRVSPRLSKWLKDHDYAPTGIFYEAVRELGFEEQ